MPKRNARHPAKTISAEDAARLVKSGMWVDFGGGIAQPDAFDRALAARAAELSGVKVRSCLSVRPLAVLEADPKAQHFDYYSWHMGGYERAKADKGIGVYVPINLGEVPDYYRRFIASPDVAVIKTTPKDENGYYNFGPTLTWIRAMTEAAKTVIVEVSPNLPYACGKENGLHESEVDFVIEGTDLPPEELRNPPISEVDRAVARHVLEEIEDGACLQIGIGAMPNAACSLLAESGIRDLGIHTEMLTDGMVELWRAGRVSGARKQLDPGKIVYSFALGGRSTYDAIHRNDAFEIRVADYTNMPHIIMQNDRAVSINNTTQIDLQGQACSESDGHRQLSGSGGQLQFVRGSYASKGGKSFMLLSSVYERRGVRKSRIVLDLTPGNVVTTPRTDIMYVVTEYGIVNLKGLSIAERARALIGLAHPDFREQLEREALEARVLPRHVVGATAA
ncbi:MAG: 4-hydroxybutyrate CoA-transferase [Alphaproteobacteria bacterium]|nr:4-hydroxybutyrate CoA-transferase [Alphaproteobacteria bacterium]